MAISEEKVFRLQRLQRYHQRRRTPGRETLATPNYVLRSLATVTINAQIRSHVHPRAVDHGCTELHEVPAVVRLLSIIRLNCIGASLHLAHQKRRGIAELLVLGFGLARPGVGLEARPSPHDYTRHNFCDQRTGYEEPFWPAVISNRINKPYERKFT